MAYFATLKHTILNAKALLSDSMLFLNLTKSVGLKVF